MIMSIYLHFEGVQRCHRAAQTEFWHNKEAEAEDHWAHAVNDLTLILHPTNDDPWKGKVCKILTVHLVFV
jgi:hypothetical protein